jgi:serine/threonine-protein kinase
VHRDIKPANLLFGEEGRLRIADFGLARALAEAAWTEPSGAMVGTARYASPEQVRGERVDGRADVYSLALVLVEAVTGRVPFAADTTIATLMARVDKPIDVPAELGPLRRALVRAGQPDPDDRPDAGELAVALMAAAEELPRPAPLPLAGAVALGALPDDERDPTQLPPTAAVPTVPPTTTVAADATSVDLPTAAAVAPAPVYDEPPPEVARRRRWPKVLVSLLVVAALAVGGVLLWNTVLVPSHEVPELIELELTAAQALAEDNGWEVEIREDREDGSAPGIVLRQDPPAGESLREGETLVLTVSLGQELRAVPTDLRGLPLADAIVRLEQAGFTAAEPVGRHDEEVPEGSVVRTVDATPVEAETGTPITVVVSQGPNPRVVPPSEGQSIEQVCAALAAAQLGCEAGEAFSDTIAAGQVVGTEPPVGTEVPRDSVVRVLVSQGPELVPVPNVAGSDVVDAAASIEAAGLSVAGVQGNPFRTVTATNPPAGTRVQRGSGVMLITR